MNFKSIKLWVNIITLGALVLLVVLSRDQIADTFNSLGSLNYLWLLLIIPIQLGNYFAVAKFYQSYLKNLQEKIPFKDLYKIGLEMNFVNNVFPSGGLSGFGYLGIRFKKFNVKASKTTLIQTSRHVLTFVAFIIYLLLALFLLSIFGDASRLTVLISTALSMVIIFGSLVFWYIISDKTRIKNFTAALPKLLNKVIGKFRKGNKQTINIDRVEKLFGDLHDDYVFVRKNWQKLRFPFLWTMFMNLTEVATIFVVYLSFGELVNPGAIIIAYAVANIAGLISIFPGGVGIYEWLMTAVMASSGVARGLALSSTVVYRVLNMGIFLPIGYFLYQKALREDNHDQSKKIAKLEDEFDHTNL